MARSWHGLFIHKLIAVHPHSAVAATPPRCPAKAWGRPPGWAVCLDQVDARLAERLTGVRPDTRVLYMSGYAQPVLASQGTLEPGVALLEKPFTAADLLSAVRRRLDG